MPSYESVPTALNARNIAVITPKSPIRLVTNAFLPAPAADYQCDVDGKTVVISVNESGLISAVEEVMVEDAEMSAEIKDSILAEVAEVMKSTLEATFAKIEELTSELKKLKEEKVSKFQSEAKTGVKEVAKMTANEILKNIKNKI